MTTDTVRIEEFITRNGITLVSVAVDNNPHMEGSADMDNYKVTLVRKLDTARGSHAAFDAYLDGKCIETVFQSASDSAEDVKSSLVNHDGYDPSIVVRKRRAPSSSRMTLHYSKGIGHHGAEPEADEVLDCLASDAAGIENARSFEDWCGDYGYEPDSRKAEKIYKTCQHQAARLKTFLGDELYDQLLWHTERE